MTPGRTLARRSGFTPAGVGNALPDVALAAVFLLTWIAPQVPGHRIVRWLFLVMAMELIVIQSAGLMGTVALSRANRVARGTAIVAFAGFYSLFAAAFAIAMANWWPVVGFWAMTLNRLLGVVLNQVPDEDTRAFVARGWLAGVTCYFAGLFLVILLPIPPLGLTAAYLAAHPVAGSEWWGGQSQKLAAFGVFYYALTAWSELNAHRWAGELPPLRKPRERVPDTAQH